MEKDSKNPIQCNFNGEGEMDHLIKPLLDKMFNNYHVTFEERDQLEEWKKEIVKRTNRQFFHHCINELKGEVRYT